VRRAEKELTDRSALDALLLAAPTLFLSLADEGGPYVVPLTFGWDGECLWLHSALEGKKVDLLRQSPLVGFALVAEQELVPGDPACRWTMRYRSVRGKGVAEFITDPDQKVKGLECLMSKFAPGPYHFDEKSLARVLVIRVRITELSAKQSGYSSE
jgi:nitroimidazol reductase NimA-like FMN-containing flavoprotein (pyridoxamine 5'-phosphate oxidase superfamily)